MKTIPATLLLLFLVSTCSGQNFKYEFPQAPGELRYNLRDTQAHRVKKDQLERAERLGDFIPFYPDSWIADYRSVQITVTVNGQTLTAKSRNDVLTEEQKNLLRKIGYGSDIVVDALCSHKNPVTGKPEEVNMHNYVTLAPETEAEFTGDQQQMEAYFKRNCSDQVVDRVWLIALERMSARFMVNENGVVSDARIQQSSGSREIDDLFLNAIRNMKGWKPARDARGVKVKEEFVVSADSGKGC
ncbi:MAG: energy transducer TonB [Flavobacteriales bacterium]|nr:energy transducer TonB [Flavobacteriales bacterium]MCB9447345.1 energy transducer TonB [Flavobacteriales bacterium]